MIAIAMPVGSSHGWGVCGKYVSRELSALTGGQARLLTMPFTAADVGDELEFQALAELLMKKEELAALPVAEGVRRLACPLLSCIVDKQLMPAWPQIRGTRTVGYTFFEDNVIDPAWIENARRHFEVVTTGSTWCTEILKASGLEEVHTVVQGIDPRVFFPMGGDAREFLRDRFVIFSGGKCELRKGQDIVMRAVKVMQERHKDVVLVNAWFNAWPESLATMRDSPHIRWPDAGGGGVNPREYVPGMTRVLAENGLDVSRVVTLSPRPNALMARVYRNSDVGIFPNRCEGGTNLVLMEYMACGKPVVATASTGHADIVTGENAKIIDTRGEREITAGGRVVARWPEPDVEDAVEKLEWAYQNRGALGGLGERAGLDLARHTWARCAEGFLRVLV